MKLVAKLTAALVVATCALFVLFAYRAVGREHAALDAQRQHSEHLILRALSTAVAEVWRHNGREAALRLVAEADAREDGLRIRWVWLDAPAGDPEAPVVGPDLAKGGGGQEILDGEGGAGERAVVYAPVEVGEPRRGAIELSASLEEERRFLREGAYAAALAVVALVLVSGLIALGLGVLFVGRPVQRIVDKARRIGEGDLSGPLLLSQRDELGRVADEINRMCARLDEARQGLARETSARIAALEQLRHADRLSTVGKLASGIAHELGTPLNVVGGRAKRIQRRDPPADTAEDARIIVEQTDRITAIIRQLLDFARQRSAHKAPGDIGAVARGVVQMLEPLAQKRKVTLRLDDGGARHEAEIDIGQIQQALTNLVMNGIQAMPRGGALTVSIDRRRARPRGATTPSGDAAAPEGEYLAVRVRDQGEGIRPEHLPHLFEPFFTTKDVGEGTGLGLSVTFGLIEEHGGWIEVESEPGQGAAFTVYLPARYDRRA